MSKAWKIVAGAAAVVLVALVAARVVAPFVGAMIVLALGVAP